jgi:transcription elongation factor Elf1
MTASDMDASIKVLGVIAACPFCEGSRVVVHAWDSHGRHFAVVCRNSAEMCEARGPRRYDAQSAVDAWNERAGQ